MWGGGAPMMMLGPSGLGYEKNTRKGGRWLSISLEEHLVRKCSFKRGVLCVDGGIREDINFGYLWITIDHLLLYCDLWVSIFSPFGLERDMHQRVVELL
jgi:hypothetical protein